MDEKPTLIEPGIKTFLNTTLKECHQFKTNYQNSVFNIGLGIVFLMLLSALLFIKYRGKPTKAEQREKDRLKKEYILSKIQNFQEAREKIHQRMITGLPSF